MKPLRRFDWNKHKWIKVPRVGMKKTSGRKKVVR